MNPLTHKGFSASSERVSGRIETSAGSACDALPADLTPLLSDQNAEPDPMIAQPPDSRSATVRDWTDVVRRSRLGRTTKAVALTLATYADADGTRVFPGIARLSFDCELGYNVVQASLAKLRQFKLIELVRAGSIRGSADEYRLTIPEDLDGYVSVPSPAQARKEIEAIRERRRGKYRPVDISEAPVDNSDLHPTATGAGIRTFGGPAPHAVGAETRPAPHGVLHLHPTPLAPTSQDLFTTTTHQEMTGFRTELALPRARRRRRPGSPSSRLVRFELEAA